LKRLRAQEAEALREAQQKLSDDQDQQPSGPSRQEVSKAIEDLRAKLEEKRKVRQLPDSVEGARNDVVRCLRENDRRPLDCWREVEAFKEEVRKLEKGWVDKVVS
jgi:altered-inheritance-of-mitochondria protein 13